MRSIGQFALLFGTVVSALSVADVAIAQDLLTRLSGAPAPLIGIGLPVAGLVVGAVWLVRRVKS
jgi:hypothetical protein